MELENGKQQPSSAQLQPPSNKAGGILPALEDADHWLLVASNTNSLVREGFAARQSAAIKPALLHG